MSEVEATRDYGPAITRGAWLDFVPRLRNRFVTRAQRRVLALFSRLAARGRGDRVFARMARRIVGGYLYSVKVEVNRGCNLACRMCYVRRSPMELERALVDRLFAHVRGCGVRIEILGGEPLLREDIAAIVTGAKRQALSPLVSLYTNGVLATPSLARVLKDAGLDVAMVTLISQRERVHDSFVGRAGAWADTVRGIAAFRDAGIETYTFTAIHAENAEDVRAIHAFAKTELSVGALFYPYVPQTVDDSLFLSPEGWHAIKHWVLFEACPDHAAFVRDFFMLTGNACSGGNFVLTVKADGRVQPCPFVDDLPLGDLNTADIWTIHRQRFKGTDLLELKRPPEECRECAYLSVCAGGCRAANRMLFGTYSRRDPRCLGPYTGPIDRAGVCDRVPSFF